MTHSAHAPVPAAWPLPYVCSIVPPYLVDRLGRSDDGGLTALAQLTRRLDDRHREARLAAPRVASAAATKAAAGTQRTIYDAGGTETLPGTEKRAEGAAASGDTDVDHAYDHLGDTYTFYADVLGRDSIDGAGLPLRASVHYGDRYPNAFWNGEQMVFGDGDGTIFTTFTGPLDVTGHELTHGVTQYSANLTYQGQSGALNESVSDVFGSLVKQYKLKQSADAADWLIGAGMFAPGVQGEALRSMKAPGTAYDDPQLGKDPQPGDMSGYVDTSDDEGGVHTNSGIPNHAFYLAATALGGNAWEKAGRAWYDALTGGAVEPGADFAAFAQATADAGTKLGADVGDAIRAAWTQVGVR